MLTGVLAQLRGSKMVFPNLAYLFKVIIHGDKAASQLTELQESLRMHFDPFMVVLHVPTMEDANSHFVASKNSIFSTIQKKKLESGEVYVYRCDMGVCSQPVLSSEFKWQ